MATVAIARKSLRQFAAGRILSAVVGFATLLVLVRVLPRSDYGVYVALFASFEILQLAASPGAYAVVFRYVPELRVPQARTALVKLFRWLTAYRAVTLLLVAAAFGAGAPLIAQTLGAREADAAIRLFAVVMIFEGLARFFDATFESLLEQGMAQLSILLRNSAKLLTMLALSDFARTEFSLGTWLQAESLTSAFGCVVSAVLMTWHLRRRLDGIGGITSQAPHSQIGLRRMFRFAVPTYFAQLLYIASGVELVKLLISRLGGPAAAAPFGFAAALTGTVNRYLPSFLLVGWLRPIFVSARNGENGVVYLATMSSVIIKFNLLMLMPVLVGLGVAGRQVVNALGGGRMDDAEHLLYLLSIVLLLQSFRSVVSLVGMTFELGRDSLGATLRSLWGLALGAGAFLLWGTWAVCCGLIASEAIWATYMLRRLAKHGFSVRWDAAGLCKIGVSALVPGVAALLIARWAPVQLSHGGWMALAIGAALACVGLSVFLKPLAADERAMVRRLVPARFVLW